jgi:hypothetical protein
MIRFVYDVQLPEMLDNPEASQRALGRAHNKAGKAGMGWFVSKRLRLRFTGQVQNELNFEERDEKYDNRKRFTGAKGIAHRFKHKTINQVMSAGGSRIIASGRAKKRNVRLIIKNLNPGYRRRPESGKPPMASELQRMTAGEVAQIAKIYGETLASELQREIDKASKKRKKIR